MIHSGSTRSEVTASRKNILSFPYTDVIDRHIVYVQSDHKGKEPTTDAFLFYVTDGVNQSPLVRFNISISVSNLSLFLTASNIYLIKTFYRNQLRSVIFSLDYGCIKTICLALLHEISVKITIKDSK